MGVGQNERQFASPPISEAPDENCSSARMSQGSKATTPWEDRRRPQLWSSERQACLPQGPLSAGYRRAGACASAAVSHHSLPQPSATWDLLEDRTVIKTAAAMPRLKTPAESVQLSEIAAVLLCLMCVGWRAGSRMRFS